MTANLLVVGSVAFDTVRTPFGSADGVLGGSAVYASVAASFFTPVRLVAAVGQDFDASSIEVLRRRGIDLAGLQSVPGRTFRWAGEYGFDLNNPTTLSTELGVFASFRPTLPESFRDSEFVFLGNIDPEIQSEVLGQVRSPRLIACDTMNFWIERKPEELARTLEKVGVLLINDSEARQLAGEPNLVRAAHRIGAMGPGTIVIKRGEHGALMFRDGSVFAAPAYPLETVLDPTGAGDSFAGGFLGYLSKLERVTEAGLRKAIIVGSVMASLNVEDFSLARLMRTEEHEIRQRYQEFRRLTVFEELE